jgi:hypothetical protein
MPTVQFRFYEELNDHLPIARRKCGFAHAFDGAPAIKDVIEALGVPHTEIDLIIVDGKSVCFSHRLRGGERVAVYPMFSDSIFGRCIGFDPSPCDGSASSRTCISGSLRALCACSDSTPCIQRRSMTRN